MARPPLPLGTPGSIKVTETKPKVFVARCRFRDHYGVTRHIRAHGGSQTAARSALHLVIQERQRGGGSRAGELTPASRFREAATVYLARVERRREDSTRALYAFHLESTILPALGDLRLRECTVARLDAFLGSLEPRYAANTRRKLRSIVSGVMQVAVLHEAVAHNPVRDLDRIEQPKGQRKAAPRGLTACERRTLLDWLDGSSAEPAVLRKQKVARAAELPELVRFMLGTGLRIGEALACRWCDVNLDVPVVTPESRCVVPVVTIAGNVTWVKGKSLVRHDGKSDAALRVIPVPASRSPCSALATSKGSSRSGRSSPPPAAAEPSPTGGPQTCAGPCARYARRSAWTGSRRTPGDAPTPPSWTTRSASPTA